MNNGKLFPLKLKSSIPMWWSAVFASEERCSPHWPLLRPEPDCAAGRTCQSGLQDLQCVEQVSGRPEETRNIYCPVRSVSWVRVRDGHILTVDGEVFTSDSRYQQWDTGADNRSFINWYWWIEERRGYQSNQLFAIKHFQDILSHQQEAQHLESQVCLLLVSK